MDETVGDGGERRGRREHEDAIDGARDLLSERGTFDS
jgi:hypothetical protein